MPQARFGQLKLTLESSRKGELTMKGRMPKRYDQLRIDAGKALAHFRRVAGIKGKQDAGYEALRNPLVVLYSWRFERGLEIFTGKESWQARKALEKAERDAKLAAAAERKKRKKQG